MTDDHQNEQFIDADTDWRADKNNYESIVLKQMQKCVDVLSKEVIGGSITVQNTKTGAREIYVEDVRELIVNTVWTFRTLMSPYTDDTNLKDKNPDTLIKQLLQDIADYQKKLGEIKVKMEGRGEVKIKDLGALPKDNPIWLQFMNYKVMKYREMFDILTKAFNKHKADIEAASVE